jgi:hypothetical protein
MAGLAHAVSTDPADTAANDGLVVQVRAKLPSVYGNIALDRRQQYRQRGLIQNRSQVGDRKFFQDVLAKRRLSVGEVLYTRHSGRWILALGDPVEEQDGNVRAVLATGTQLEHFQKVFRTDGLP